jgi:hypothetical protein
MSRTLWPLAALAKVALISLAGCSNAPAETGTGSSGGNNPADNHEKAVKFAECMRNNGVSEFPDPDASGTFAYGIKAGSLLDPSTAAWTKAIGACKDLEPPGALGSKASAQSREAGLKFAQCMRDNGVKDFPDPTENGPLINVEGARCRPGFQAAVQKCRDVLAGGLGGQ